MATKVWRGDAQEIPQVTKMVIAGTVAVDDTFTVTVNRQDITITVASGADNQARIENAVTLLIAAIGQYSNTDFTEFYELSCASHSTGGTIDGIELTGPTIGADFTITGATSGSGTITPTTTTTPSGPNWISQADNWHNPAAPTTPTAPADGDHVIYRDNSVDCLYGLEALTGFTLSGEIEASYTGKIGLEVRNTNYFEYRPTSLAVGWSSLVIGQGDGNGSPRLRFDLEAISAAIEVFRTGSSVTNLPACIFKGGGATTSLKVHRGSVGVAVEQGDDTATVQNLTLSYIDSQARDASVWLGDGVGTVASIVKSGGVLRIQDVVITALTQTGGSTTVLGDETIAAATIDAGSLVYMGSGTITALTVGTSGTADFSRAEDSRTVTDCTLYAGATLSDPHSTVTWTNGISLIRCGLTKVSLDVGVHKDFTIATGA